LRKGIITEENFRVLMILYSEIGGHVLTPFFGMYLRTRIWELVKYRSTGERVVIGYQGGYRWELMPMVKKHYVAKSGDSD